MKPTGTQQIGGAEFQWTSSAFDETLAFLIDRLAFRLDAIFPADDPRVASISGHGMRIRLVRGAGGRPVVLRLLCQDPGAFAAGQLELVAPDGTRILVVEAEPRLEVPPLQPALVVSRSSEASWVVGRAGMQYRDLIPGRQGGRFVASHIRIPSGGPVPDYVHYHDIRFQMIYCYRGWVRVAYEDQGPPLLMQAGDCVLQPPGIRHRVLECAPGMEVVEMSCPGEHETRVDHELCLPSPDVRRDRDFGGQRFAFDQAASADWGPWRLPGFESRETSVASATSGLAGVQVARRCAETTASVLSHRGELLFVFVCNGQATLRCDGHPPETLSASDAVVVPAGLDHALEDCSEELEVLEVTLPAELDWTTG